MTCTHGYTGDTPNLNALDTTNIKIFFVVALWHREQSQVFLVVPLNQNIPTNTVSILTKYVIYYHLNAKINEITLRVPLEILAPPHGSTMNLHLERTGVQSPPGRNVTKV